MEIRIDDMVCVRCFKCIQISKDVFYFKNDKVYAKVSNLDLSLNGIIKAKANCPFEAISFN